MMAISKAQQDAVNKYKRANYDRLELLVPKGKKEVIKSFAGARGESVNGFINNAIEYMMNGSQSVESSVGVSAPLVVSDDIARVNEHIGVTGETTGEFIHRAIGDTIDRDSALMKMGISPVKKKSGE